VTKLVMMSSDLFVCLSVKLWSKRHKQWGRDNLPPSSDTCTRTHTDTQTHSSLCCSQPIDQRAFWSPDPYCKQSANTNKK